MSVQLLQACCCGEGGECTVYPSPGCVGTPATWAFVSTDQTIKSFSGRLDWWREEAGCDYAASAIGSVVVPVAPCERTLPDIGDTSNPELFLFTEFVGGSDLCVALGEQWGMTCTMSLDSAGNILSGRVRSARVNSPFNLNALEVNYPDTLDEDINSTSAERLHVNWSFTGGIMRIFATMTWEQNAATLEKTVMQAEMLAWPFVPQEGGEVCDPSPTVFEPADPPDWYDPEPGECPPGCAPGPIGFAAPVSGLSEGGIPTQEEWELAGNTWGCSQGITLQCSPQLIVFAIVPCGAPVSPDQFQGLCDIFGPGSSGLSLPPGGANQSTGCGNCGNGGVL